MLNLRILKTLEKAWVPGFFFLICLAALSHYPRFVSDVTYILILIFVVGGLVLGRARLMDPEFRKLLSPLPFILFALWFYGVVLGLANDVDPRMVFRNFAAMCLYPFVYVVIIALRPEPRLVLNALAAGSAAFVAVVIYLLLTVKAQGTVDSIGLMIFRYHYFLATVPAIAVMMAWSNRSAVFGPVKTWRWLLVFGIFVAAFYSGSRAFYLTMAVIMLCIGLSFLPNMSRFQKAAALGLGYLILAIAMFWFNTGALETMTQAIQTSIKMEVSSASPRSEQLARLMPEMNLFGHGLGSPLQSGYERDTVYTYAFELSYVSLAHKIGLIGAAIFVLCMAVHLVKTFRQMVRGNHQTDMIFAFSVLGFLISSWWNPSLFAPMYVCLFCLSLYFRRLNETAN